MKEYLNNGREIIILTLKQISQADKKRVKVVLQTRRMEKNNTMIGQIRNDFAYRVTKIFQLEELTLVSLCKFQMLRFVKL